MGCAVEKGQLFQRVKAPFRQGKITGSAPELRILD